MGADLVVTIAELRESEEEAIARVAKIALTETDLERFDGVGCGDFWDMEEFTEDTVRQMRERLVEAVKVTYSIQGYPDRDSFTFTIDGSRNFVATGGTTWGDDPSSAYVDVSLFTEFVGYPYHESPDSEVVREWNEVVNV